VYDADDALRLKAAESRRLRGDDGEGAGREIKRLEKQMPTIAQPRFEKAAAARDS